MQYLINRSPYATENRVLSSNALKIIAAITMVLDHIGVYLVGSKSLILYMILRLIGRMSFPLFAYCIAEGCRYTRNKKKRFFVIFGLGILFEAVWVVYGFLNHGGFALFDTYAGDLFGFLMFIRNNCVEGNVFLTFACSILLIYIMQAAKQKMAEKKWGAFTLWALLFAVAVVASYGFHYLLNGISYGIYGILLPVLVAAADYDEGRAPAFFQKLDHPMIKMALLAVGLVIMAVRSSMKVAQTFGLLALIPLSMYNGKPGSAKMKWWFYVFYPAHLVVLWLIGMLIQ